MEVLELVRRGIERGPDLGWFEEFAAATGVDVGYLARRVAPEEFVELLIRYLRGEGAEYETEVKPIYERLLGECRRGVTERCKAAVVLARWIWELVEAAVSLLGGVCR